jgi:hypothetical protein
MDIIGPGGYLFLLQGTYLWTFGKKHENIYTLHIIKPEATAEPVSPDVATITFSFLSSSL